jgi:hypothetical protein
MADGSPWTIALANVETGPEVKSLRSPAITALPWTIADVETDPGEEFAVTSDHLSNAASTAWP